LTFVDVIAGTVSGDDVVHDSASYELIKFSVQAQPASVFVQPIPNRETADFGIPSNQKNGAMLLPIDDR